MVFNLSACFLWRVREYNNNGSELIYGFRAWELLRFFPWFPSNALPTGADGRELAGSLLRRAAGDDRAPGLPFLDASVRLRRLFVLGGGSELNISAGSEAQELFITLNICFSSLQQKCVDIFSWGTAGDNEWHVLYCVPRKAAGSCNNINTQG